MKVRVRRVLRGCLSLALALATLWGVAAAAPLSGFEEAASALRGIGRERLALALIRFERGAPGAESALPLPAAAALHTMPLLLAPRGGETPAAPEPDAPELSAEPEAPETADVPEAAAQPAEAETVSPLPPITVRDNGVTATTLRVSDPAGYLTCGQVLVRNTSSAALGQEQLGFDFPAALAEGAPQVLIVHTHGCEAYTMPAGEEYEPSDDHRTLDEHCNVLRVGDEIAQVLERAGIGVLHDRTLHDYPNYSGSYNRSLATVERCLAEHPTIGFVLDVHRDAVADASGRQYKLLCAEEPDAAQLEFVLGSDGGGLPHERWRDNLKLACAVQETLLRDHPTLMRPIVVRNSRYNQQASVGSLLLEVGTAGNSLEEALVAARLFAEGFAETIQGQSED